MSSVRLPFCPNPEDVRCPRNWTVYRIEDAYEQLPVGKRYDKKTVSLEGNVPVLDQSHAGILGYHSESPGIEASPEAPVVTFANHTCAMRLVKSPFSVIQNVFPLIGKSGICDTRFLYYASQGRQQTEEYKGHHPAWRRSYFALPCLETQLRIANVLCSLDNLIENNRRRIEILEEMAQAIYREWFVHFRFPGHETATFVDSPLGPIPEDWDVAPLEQIADVAWGDTKVTKKSYSATGFNAYSAAGRDGFLPYFDFDRSGVVLAAIGSVGRTWFVQGKWSCIKNTIRFWSLDSRTPDAYLYLATREPSFWPTRGAAQPFIALSDAKAVRVIVPSKSVAQGLDRFLSPLNRKALHCRAEVANLELSRDLLLPKLVSGEIDVCDLDLDAVLEGAV